MSLLFNHEEETPQLQVDDTVKAYLLEGARWAKFIAVFGIVIISLMLLMGLTILFFGGGITSVGYSSVGMSPYTIGAIYIVGALVYFYPVWALLKFANNAKRAINTEDQSLLQSSVRFLKTYFKVIGIVIIIMIIFYALFFLFILVVGSTAALSM